MIVCPYNKTYQILSKQKIQKTNGNTSVLSTKKKVENKNKEQKIQ
jgi:hypothetical protein